MEAIYAIVSVIIVSLVSLVAAVPLLVKKKVSKKALIFLLSVSVGVLLSTVFMHFLPEIIEEGHYSMNTAVYLLLGFLLMFVLEKFVHYHHNKQCEKEGGCAHGHAYNLAPVNLIGDGIHNFVDGLVIAGAYAANFTLGVAATISIIFHEIPQEVADFGVLLYSGLSKKKALVFNFLSAATAILGTIIGIAIAGAAHEFIEFIIPFAAGNFIYIAASNLTPQLHRHCKLRDTIIHIFAIVLGIAIIAAVTMYSHGHGH